MSDATEGGSGVSNTRNSAVLRSFIRYCEAHPEQRFWQALRNWSGIVYIYASEIPPDEFHIIDGEAGYFEDTFYWEGRVGED